MSPLLLKNSVLRRQASVFGNDLKLEFDISLSVISKILVKHINRVCVFVYFQGVKEVVETWEKMKFSVLPYFKGTQERGSILGSVDEILLNLDNDAMNLQGMASSRFVGPFLGTVQQWEKHLSLIRETIEVSESGHISHHTSIKPGNHSKFP